MTELSDTQPVVTATEQRFRMQDQRSPVVLCPRRDCRTPLKPLPQTLPRPSSGHFPTPRPQPLTCSAPMIVWPLIARHPPATVPATLPWCQVPGIGPSRGPSVPASPRKPPRGGLAPGGLRGALLDRDQPRAVAHPRAVHVPGDSQRSRARAGPRVEGVTAGGAFPGKPSAAA